MNEETTATNEPTEANAVHVQLAGFALASTGALVALTEKFSELETRLTLAEEEIKGLSTRMGENAAATNQRQLSAELISSALHYWLRECPTAPAITSSDILDCSCYVYDYLKREHS